VARKRLIKGANASRVEERIARVPADLAGPEAGGGGIFGALRAMEAVAAAEPKNGPQATPRAVPKARKNAETPKPAAIKKSAARKPSRAAAPSEKPPEKPGRLGPSDFTQAEREEIVRCCSNYRNQLPIYLLAVQKEVKVIDSVIGKCKRNG
jgi:hypothetical protein